MNSRKKFLPRNVSESSGDTNRCSPLRRRQKIFLTPIHTSTIIKFVESLFFRLKKAGNAYTVVLAANRNSFKQIFLLFHEFNLLST